MNNKKKIVGISGYSGSGKSTLAKNIAQDKNVELIDVDFLAKELMNSDKNILGMLEKTFGANVLNDSGVDFKKLGEVAFKTEDNLMLLNEIVHPPLLEKLRKRINKTSYQELIIDAALIPYWKIENWFNELYWINVDRDIRINRIMNRVKNLSIDDIRNRLKIQESLFQVPEKGWMIIENSSSEDRMYQKYLEMEASFE